ncbi:unnamed protein product [Calypogeia fissa]
MDQYFGVNEAEEVGKELTHVRMTLRAMTTKYKGQPFVIENSELAAFFRVTRPFDRKVPLKYTKPTLTYQEAKEFLKEEGDFSAQWTKRNVNYGSITNKERRWYVELVVKLVIVKSEYYNITSDHLAVAKTLLEGSLHPLQVWKEGMKHSISPKGLNAFPSLVNYVASNVFSTIRLYNEESPPVEESNQEEACKEGSQRDEDEEGQSSLVNNET